MVKTNVSIRRKVVNLTMHALAFLPTEFFIAGFTFLSHLPLGRRKEEKEESSIEDYHDPHHFI